MFVYVCLWVGDGELLLVGGMFGKRLEMNLASRNDGGVLMRIQARIRNRKISTQWFWKGRQT